jgi:hypothetical protein
MDATVKNGTHCTQKQNKTKSKFYFTFFLYLLNTLPHTSSPQLPLPHNTTTTLLPHPMITTPCVTTSEVVANRFLVEVQPMKDNIKIRDDF